MLLYIISSQIDKGKESTFPLFDFLLVAGVGFEPTTFGLWGQSQDTGPYSNDFRPVDLRIQPSVKALAQLSPQNQDLVVHLIRQLAQREGINVALTPGTLTTPAEGIPLWVADMKAREYSPRTIECYVQAVRHYLTCDSVPTTLSIKQYVARRLGAGHTPM